MSLYYTFSRSSISFICLSLTGRQKKDDRVQETKIKCNTDCTNSSVFCNQMLMFFNIILMWLSAQGN